METTNPSGENGMSLLHLFVETSREIGQSDAEIAAQLRKMANALSREIRKTALKAEPTPTSKTGRSIAADRRASRTGLAFLTAVGTGKARKPATKPKRPMA